MVMRVSFRLPDAVIVHFLCFLNVFIRILGREDIVIPTSMYQIKKVIGELKFERCGLLEMPLNILVRGLY